MLLLIESESLEFLLLEWLEQVVSMILSWSAQDEEAAVQDLQVVLESEDGSQSEELSENAPDRPDVNAKEVIFRAQDDLWSTIPQ